MDTTHIREFVMLAECLNFSEAAERLFISQSSLSKHIQALERELGIALFLRTTRSIRLSEAGALYLPYARKLTHLCFEAENGIDRLKSRSPQLTIAVLHNPQYYNMAKYITGFQQIHPELDFSIVEADEAGLYDMFRKRLVNIFPTFSNFQGPEPFSFMPVFESAIVAIFPAEHPCAGRESVRLEALAEERLLLPTRGGCLSELIHGAFHRMELRPNVVYEGSSVGCIDLVKAGLGVSLHAREFAAMLVEDPAVACVPICPAVSFRGGLGYRDPQEMTRAEQLYLSYMKRYDLNENNTGSL